MIKAQYEVVTSRHLRWWARVLGHHVDAATALRESCCTLNGVYDAYHAYYHLALSALLHYLPFPIMLLHFHHTS